ncbi:hypothetical protein ACIPLR_11295 [Herbaspirillum huttiense]|uniref:hypothetical protein n=1 Tax=Herbaspirillum huttiense TaxID=863372 RepID=UPI00380B39D7
MPIPFKGIPTGGQIFVLSLVSFAVWTADRGFDLLKADNLFGLIFVGLSAGAIGASLFAGRKSQRDADLAAAQPTMLRDYLAGIDVTMSPVVQRDKDAMRHLGELAQIVAVRRPLPEPAGKVDSNGVPDESRKSEAVSEVNMINAETRKLDQSLINLISSRLSVSGAIQETPTSEMKSDIAAQTPTVLPSDTNQGAP